MNNSGKYNDIYFGSGIFPANNSINKSVIGARSSVTNSKQPEHILVE